jgi:hypothetical protein
MSESQVRSILQSVAEGALSPAEAATLLDALPADDGARPEGVAAPDAKPTPEPATILQPEPQPMPAPAPVATPAADPTASAVPVPPASPAPPAPADVPDLPSPPRPPAPDDTQEFYRHAGTRAGTKGREQLVVTLSGPSSIEVVCATEVTEPYAEGPNTVTVTREDNGFTVSGDVGDDSVVMLPSDLDLTISANGAQFSLVGLVGTMSADLNVGDVTISGVFAQGDSRIHANTGEIDVTFLTGSDVEVIANAPSALNADGMEHVGRGRWSLGGGTAKLSIDGNVGAINLRSG